MENAKRYSKSLNTTVKVPVDSPGVRSVYHTYVIQTDYRNELKKYLEEHGIESKIHYPIPIHQQKAAGKQESLTICEQQAKRILSLPVHQYLTEDEVDYVVENIGIFHKLD